MLIYRLHNVHTWSDSLAWVNATSDPRAAYTSYECAVLRPQASLGRFPLLPLCVCILQMLWTYIFIWGAMHGIVSIPTSAEMRRSSKTNSNYHHLSVDIPPQNMLASSNKRSDISKRKGRGIIRDNAFDEALSRTLASHVELTMNGFLLLPTRSGFFAPVLILVVSRSLLLNILTPEAFACVTFGERRSAKPVCLDSSPVCVPWASPSLRQHIIAKVMNSFRCSSSSDSLHDYLQCCDSGSNVHDYSIANTDELGKVAIQLFTHTIRLRPGTGRGSNSDSHLNKSATVKPSKRSKSSYPKSKNGKQPRSLIDQGKNEASDEEEEEEDKGPPKKRKRPNTVETINHRLPCIFHVFDRRAHTRDPRWRYCNPQTASYPDPSALSRHLQRRHDLIDGKASVQKTDLSIAVCKNCWTTILGSLSHWHDGRYTCDKPAQRLTPTDKWWVWFEAFCGPKTASASQYLDYLMDEARPHFDPQVASQYPLGIQQRPSHDCDLPPYVEPHHTTVGSNWCTTSNFGPMEQLQPQFRPTQPQFPPAQHVGPSPTTKQYDYVTQPGPSAALILQPRAVHPVHHTQFRLSDLSGQSLAQDTQPLSSSRAGVFQRPSDVLCQPSTPPNMDSHKHLTYIENLMARLQLEEEKTRSADQRALIAEEKARKLEEKCKKQSNIIEKLMGPVSPTQAKTFSASEDIFDPALFSTPARADTGNSTESDLSGIAERAPLNSGTVEDFNADVASGAVDVFQHDPQGFQYLTELDVPIPRASHGMPSVDSGYGTNKTDDSAPRFVRPSDTILSPDDSASIPLHT